MATVKLDHTVEILKLLKSFKKGLTTLEIAVKLSSNYSHSVLPSDLTYHIRELRNKGIIVQDGRRKNPVLRGKRISRTATVYKIV